MASSTSSMLTPGLSRTVLNSILAPKGMEMASNMGPPGWRASLETLNMLNEPRIRRRPGDVNGQRGPENEEDDAQAMAGRDRGGCRGDRRGNGGAARGARGR